jgi:DNA-binding NtrC family response regulator
MANILIVGDAGGSAAQLAVFLGSRGHVVQQVSSGALGLEALSRSPCDLLLVDLMIKDMNGIDMLRRVRTGWPETQVVVLTRYASVETSVAAFRAGALDYLVTPVVHDEIVALIRTSVEAREPDASGPSPARASRGLRGRDNATPDDDGPVVVGSSAAMHRIVAQVRKVANARSSVLILGETGTGKELFAKAIHHFSSRRGRPFIAINCSAIPEQLLESELFGHAKGAFSGAIATKKGLFEEATGGTLFLDEVGDLSLALQAKLLRVLEDQEIRPVGQTRSTKVDVRFVFATNRDLLQMVNRGSFRDDLYYRINVVSIAIPPLRERTEDIPLLVDYFLGRFAESFGKPLLRVAPGAMRLLESVPWRGNVRELQNVVERAVLLVEGDSLGPDDLLLPTAGAVPRLPSAPDSPDGEVDGSVDDYIRSFVARHQADHSEEELAGLLGMTRKTLWEKRRRLGIPKPGRRRRS